MVVATKRLEGSALGPAKLLTLGPLDLASVAELVGEHRALELYTRSGGHPLFLQELAAATSPELPTSVREAVAARVDRMGGAATTLRAAAILGSEVDIDLLAGVLDEGAHLVDRALLDPGRLGHPFALHHAHLTRVLGLGMQGRPVEALAAVEAGQVVAIQAGEPGSRFVSVQDNLRSWVLRNLGRLDEATSGLTGHSSGRPTIETR